VGREAFSRAGEVLLALRSFPRGDPMHAPRLILATLALTLLACAPPPAAPVAPAPPKEDPVVRGANLVNLGTCDDCHTPGGLAGSPDAKRRLSGSDVGWVGPWGVSHSSNLTPDMETGLGKWSEADIVTALRSGIRPDRTPILPPMPWPHFAGLPDDDVAAIAKFLKSLPPIAHAVPADQKPGEAPVGVTIVFPEPSGWDAPATAPAPGGG
jgi:mono/diheme cytochrome c family protein